MPETSDSTPEETLPPRSGQQGGADDLSQAETLLAKTPPVSATTEDLDATIRVAAPVPRTGANSQPRGWDPPSVEQLQQMLPQYDVSGFIARGGMGAVYRGMQKTLKRPVAIKVLPPEIEDGDLQFAERFKHEAQAMARLTHPNIVAVFDAGETPGCLLYFVMEFVEGTDVARLISSEGLLEPQRAISITVAVCEALAFAHEEGIVHRDIKPSNIMIDKRGRVKVADFGLAKSVNVEATLLTGTHMAMGTPDFIAPEALIPGIKIDGRADLYAVGVMLYQMLTGKIPRGRFQLPSGLVPQIDTRFDAIVDKAMQTDRELRYSTAIEIKTDVEKVRIVSAPPVSASVERSHVILPHPAVPPPAKPRSSGKGKVIGLALAGLLLLGAGTLLLNDKDSAARPAVTALPVAPPAVTNSPAPKWQKPPAPDAIPGMNPQAAKEVKGHEQREKAAPLASATRIPGLPDLPPLTIPPGDPGFVKEINFKGMFLHRFNLLPDCRRLLVYQDRTITLVDLETEKPLWSKAGGVCRSSSLSKDGSRVAEFRCLDDEGKDVDPRKGVKALITLRSTSDGQPIQNWTLPLAATSSSYDQLALSPSGKKLMVRVGGYRGTDLQTPCLFAALAEGRSDPIAQWSIPNHGGHLTSCLDEDRFVSTGDGAPILLKISDPGHFEPLLHDLAELRNAISPDQKVIVARLHDETLALWDIESRKRLFYFEKGPEQPHSISFAGPDLVVAVGDQAELSRPGFKYGESPQPLDVWDRKTGRKLIAYTAPQPDQRFYEHVKGAANGAFCVVRVRHYPLPPGGEGNSIHIYRLPKPGQVYGAPAKAAQAPPAPAAKPLPFTNSLGMKFVAIPGLPMFCVHETRRQDYAAYAAAAADVDPHWKTVIKDGVTISGGDDHPVCSVSWHEANAFCTWLSQKEGRTYRLPTDREWSVAVGVGAEEAAVADSIPALLNARALGKYPWGAAWPPPQGAGNFADSCFVEKFPGQAGIEGYADGFATTSPVMKFAPNLFGLHDLSGNVWEWCADRWSSENNDRVLRGGSFNVASKAELNSSVRGHNPPEWRVFTGFRCVLEQRP